MSLSVVVGWTWSFRRGPPLPPGGPGVTVSDKAVTFRDMLSYLCATMAHVALRKKRSISIPPDLDASIEEAARAAGTTYSGWLAATARKELTLRAGLAAVAAYERAEGAFTEDEISEAETRARDALARGRRSGTRSRRTA